MTISAKTVGICGTNCYFVTNQDQTVIVDPGDGYEILHQHVKENDYHPVAILLTHGHFDHMMSSLELAKEYDIPIYAYEGEVAMVEDVELNLSAQFGTPYVGRVDRVVKEGEILHLAGLAWKVLFTPGHTSGSVSYYVESEKALFDGDLIFARSVGRTDFPTGKEEDLLLSIQNQVFTLPEDVNIFSGHGPVTTVGMEKKLNMINRYLSL
ncbi:MAG: MBL fold metallo-hydrolase [Lachnospiraceae bacterium]|nr:MBL fold metallo-hydrolase [Lachnospiraceae bacterium]